MPQWLKILLLCAVCLGVIGALSYWLFG